MQGYLETALQIITDNSELLTDWIIALSMAWGVLVFTVLGIIFLILYAGKENEKTDCRCDTDVPTSFRVWSKGNKYYSARVCDKHRLGSPGCCDSDNQ